MVNNDKAIKLTSHIYHGSSHSHVVLFSNISEISPLFLIFNFPDSSGEQVEALGRASCMLDDDGN